ncbi:nucleotidyltransferase family protein [Chitiniphilus purpureus]|uniref:Nucleotidyltransferase family protein n=1 Tax=Chitiniphilus purpureus TaxID=2981137 RepID=A0ABY6DP60_9NEIS|nr:nucleotidyltransferase family protein [Chitiniphilus sp. CD1]UXY15812.1 nucleotidyltransferase family protein [Chitiniphilus sp. CD1]
MNKNIVKLVALFNAYCDKNAHIVDDECFYSNLLETLANHKMFGIASYLLQKGLMQNAPSRIYDVIFCSAEREKIKHKEYTTLCSEISTSLSQYGVPHVVRKGPTLGFLYKEAWHRGFNDLDFLINTSDRAQVLDFLKKNDYNIGIYNTRLETGIAPNRETLIQYRLNPDHLPHYYIKRDHTITRGFNVDFAFQLGWHNDEIKIKNEEVFQDAVSRDGIASMSDNWLFVDSILHLYREMFFYGLAKAGPIKFISIIDILLLQDRVDFVSRPATKEIIDIVTSFVNFTFGRSNKVDQKLLTGILVNGQWQNLAVSIYDRMSILTDQHYRDNFNLA